MKRRSQAIVALTLAAAFWAGNYVFGKVAVADMSPFSIVLLRWSIALVPLVIISQTVEHPDWLSVLRHWPFLLMQSALGLFAYNFLLYEALRSSTAFAASLINAANPALIALAAMAVLHERIGWRGAIGIAVALIGVLVVLTQGDFSTLATIFTPGSMLMIAVICSWTAYTIAMRKGPKLPPITAVTIQVAFIVIGLGSIAPFVGVTLPSSGPALGSLLFIAVFPSCLSYVLWNTALTVIPSGRAGVFLNLITVFTALWAVATGELISVAQIVGGMTIIVGVMLTSWPSHGVVNSPIPRSQCRAVEQSRQQS
ncbi:MAG: DMT family transporter [Bifidobacterium aquikefiri]|uniref:EamA-like transporter family protein n=1 Tax=Bifidobacterium aquikefiri TaxID=1653207 RepID=A0A261GBB7_9BIFI|nr:DMT family transporter [Bifidobacterium aquikefiri]OZG68465.1 EamA-like transporter family protein [Bifidobacterium aquikefiri]